METSSRQAGRGGGADRPRATVVGVVAGCGGAGASVVAAALARAAAEDRVSCVLVDADPLGGGIDLLLGAEDEPGHRWPELAGARGRLLPGLLLEGLPVIDGVAVVSCARGDPVPVPSEALEAVVSCAADAVDLVVVDCPRPVAPGRPGAVAACDLALLVVPTGVRSVVAAAAVCSTVTATCSDVRLLVRSRAVDRLSATAVGDALDLPVAGWLRHEPGLAAGLDRGEPPGLNHRGPLATLCRDLLRGVVEGRSA